MRAKWLFNLTVENKYNIEAISRSIGLYIFNPLLKIQKSINSLEPDNKKC
jgi:hypothetical protein